MKGTYGKLIEHSWKSSTSGRLSYCLKKSSGSLSYVVLLLLRTFWKELWLYRVLQILTSGLCSSHLVCLYVVGLVAPRVPQPQGSPRPGPAWPRPGSRRCPRCWTAALCLRSAMWFGRVASYRSVRGTCVRAGVTAGLLQSCSTLPATSPERNVHA